MIRKYRLAGATKFEDFNPRISYKDKFNKFGVSPKSLFWKSRGAAHQRFRQFWAEIDFAGKKVLDIGCGFGEMGNFLTKRYINVSYVGIDITPEFIKNGQKMYPQLDLKIADFFDLKTPETFDVVLASGVLNSDLPDNLNFRKKAIAKMFSLTSDVFAFNMLGGHPAPENKKESNTWYSDSLEILDYCMSLTRRVILRSHYHPRDFTILMYKIKRHIRGVRSTPRMVEEA